MPLSPRRRLAQAVKRPHADRPHMGAVLTKTRAGPTGCRSDQDGRCFDQEDSAALSMTTLRGSSPGLSQGNRGARRLYCLRVRSWEYAFRVTTRASHAQPELSTPPFANTLHGWLASVTVILFPNYHVPKRAYGLRRSTFSSVKITLRWS